LHDAHCAKCARIVQLRKKCIKANPEWHNAPVEAFGGLDSEILIVGLAPGRLGANRTGRPFTGDAAGRTLFEALVDCGLASGIYDNDADDDLRLHVAQEITNCRGFLAAEIAAMPQLACILTLGRIAHDAVLRCITVRACDAPFAHGALANVKIHGHKVRLVSSYHCSRYNMNTGRLTQKMLEQAITMLKERD